MDSFGAVIVVFTGGLVQPLVQPGSPPPPTVAVFVTLLPADADATTNTVIVDDTPAASAPVLVQFRFVDVLAVQSHNALVPIELIVTPGGIVSCTVIGAVVGALPVLLTVIA
jgi:hypothetical protein